MIVKVKFPVVTDVLLRMDLWAQAPLTTWKGGLCHSRLDGVMYLHDNLVAVCAKGLLLGLIVDPTVLQHDHPGGL